MRALFTQFSLLLGVLTALNMNTESTSALVSVAWGLVVGGLVYLILLLGDYSIHRLLDSSANRLSSVRFKNQPLDVEMSDDLLMADELPSAAAKHSEKEPLAA